MSADLDALRERLESFSVQTTPEPVLFGDLPAPGPGRVTVSWPPTWGRWVRALRGSESPEAFGARTGIPGRTVREWERGAKPMRTRMHAIAAALGVDVAEAMAVRDRSWRMGR